MSEKLANEQNLSEPVIIRSESVTFRGQIVSHKAFLLVSSFASCCFMQLNESVREEGVMVSVVQTKTGMYVTLGASRYTFEREGANLVVLHMLLTYAIFVSGAIT